MWFVLVDRLLRLEPGKEAVMLKNVSNSEDFFADHFPGHPIMPGCLILESCDQAARLLLGERVGFRRLPVLEQVENGKFRQAVRPGDSLHVHVIVVSQTPVSATVRASASVEGRTVAQAALAYRLVDSAEDAGAGRVCARMREFYALLSADPASTAAANPARATGQSREAGDA